MERMPYQDEQVRFATGAAVEPVPVVATPPVVESDWRQALPVLTARGVTLRELKKSDARTLFTMLSTEEVTRFISPPPSTVEGFERFIEWTHRERAAGAHICYGIVPNGMDAAVGIIQARQMEPGFAMAEWGFALGSPFWGSGAFVESAWLVLGFLFETVGVRRLEARVAVKNGRGNGALRKVGALQEGTLRRSFLRNGEYLDQVLWAIVDADRQRPSALGAHRVH